MHYKGENGIKSMIHRVRAWSNSDTRVGKDNSGKRAGFAAENFSCMGKIALTLVQHYDDRKGATKKTIKTKRKKSGWDLDSLLTIVAETNKLLMRLPCPVPDYLMSL